jgi:hypothetical protein
MTMLSRRAVTLGMAAVPAATLAALPETDSELRRLWSEYQELRRVYEVAKKASLEARDAFD